MNGPDRLDTIRAFAKAARPEAFRIWARQNLSVLDAAFFIATLLEEANEKNDEDLRDGLWVLADAIINFD